MDYLKKIGISLGYTFAILLVSLFFIVLLHYFNILGTKTASVFKLIALIASLFVGGYINGKRSNQNGWLEGLKMSIILILLFLLLGVTLTKVSFCLKSVLFYILILGITTFGSMVGINKRVDNSTK